MMRGENGRFGRVVTAMVTPFDAKGVLDLARAAALATWLLENGSDALVINGTTGESPTTSFDEKIALLRAVVGAVGAQKVIAGAGGNNTAEVVELARASYDAGVGAILTVAPYYNKPSQEGLFRHFSAIAEVTPLPTMLYNVPGRTITNIEPETTARLARAHENIVGIKEASANLGQIGEILRLTKDDFDIYSGDDFTVLPTLAIGGCGVVSVVSHILGNEFAAFHRAWFAGERETAAKLFLPTLPVSRAIFCAPSPAPLKYALAKIGQPVGSVRLPLVEIDAREQAIVDEALAQIRP